MYQRVDLAVCRVDLAPAMRSLGCGRVLWEDAEVVPRETVLFGSPPTKTLWSDAVMPEAEVRRRTVELQGRRRACGYPHILESECDVLHVADAAEKIRRKVEVMLSA